MDITPHSSDSQVLDFIALAQEAQLTELQFEFECFVVVCAALLRTGRPEVKKTSRRRSKMCFEGITIKEKDGNAQKID